MNTLFLPAQLSGFAQDRRKLSVAGRTLSELFANLDAIAPMIRSQMFEGEGRLRQFVGLFVNDEQVHDPEEFSIDLAPNSQVLVVFSVAGG